MSNIWREIRVNSLSTISAVVFCAVWILYALTSAPGTLFGDPSEYQFIPAIWGIAHPPGYAFYILLAGVWQRLVQIGSVAYRTNLLSGAAGAWAVSRLFLIINFLLVGANNQEKRHATLVALLSSVIVAISTDIWQHAIHANAHIVSVALTSTQLWLLFKWSDSGKAKWLFFCAFLCGIGVTHHPITVWGLPAYGLFILLSTPKFFQKPKFFIPFIIFGILGLAPFLYYVLRSPSVPFGPTDMNTWEGFFRHATAQGLRVNLFHYGLSDQFERLIVFMSLVRLQFAIPFLVCLLLGMVIMIKRHSLNDILVLFFGAGHLAFTLNSVQDVMAYLLHVFLVLGIPLAIGFFWIIRWWSSKFRKWGAVFVFVAVSGFCISQISRQLPLISLHNWREADNSVTSLVQLFKGKETKAAYVSDWEHLTPYYYYTMVEGIEFSEMDLHPVYVTGGLSWDQAVFSNLPAGPVYLSNYRREIRNLGFRLRPVGDLWKVLEPPAVEKVNPQTGLSNTSLDVGIQILGYDLPVTNVSAGDIISLTLYAKSIVSQTDIVMPYILLGDIEQRWTTDSRRLTPEWLVDEVIVERYNIYIPYTLLPGSYPLRLRFTNMSRQVDALPFNDASFEISLGEMTVANPGSSGKYPAILDEALMILGNDLCLVDAILWADLQITNAVWDTPIVVKPDDAIRLFLTWHALKKPQMSYTVFIHLIDGQGTPVMGHDYTPLGGAFPTYLWFPKWLPGQQVVDPYKLTIPGDIAPGMYWLEVGMYEMGSIRRIPQFDRTGSMTGDRYILGPVIVEY